MISDVQVGFLDPWRVMEATTLAKQYLGLITMLQWIKVLQLLSIAPPAPALLRLHRLATPPYACHAPYPCYPPVTR